MIVRGTVGATKVSNYQRGDLIRLRQDQRDQVLFGQPEKVIAVHIRR